MRLLLRVAVSAVVAGLAYLLWLVLFLTVHDESNALITTVLWIMAPLITAAGFVAGIVALDRSIPERRSLLRLYAWPLIGCTVGAAAVFWLGPMLIVFGMMAGGIAAVALNQILVTRGPSRQS